MYLSGENLFHQAILESGTEYNFWSINLPESNPENYIRQVAESLNCSIGYDDYEMMDCLREIPWQELRGADFDCTVVHIFILGSRGLKFPLPRFLNEKFPFPMFCKIFPFPSCRRQNANPTSFYTPLSKPHSTIVFAKIPTPILFGATIPTSTSI